MSSFCPGFYLCLVTMSRVFSSFFVKKSPPRLHINRLENHSVKFVILVNYFFLTPVVSYFFERKKMLFMVAYSQLKRTVCGRTFFANIIAKTKIFAKLFLPVHMGPRWSFFFMNKGRKSRDTVPLNSIYCFFYI